MFLDSHHSNCNCRRDNLSLMEAVHLRIFARFLMESSSNSEINLKSIMYTFERDAIGYIIRYWMSDLPTAWRKKVSRLRFLRFSYLAHGCITVRNKIGFSNSEKLRLCWRICYPRYWGCSSGFCWIVCQCWNLLSCCAEYCLLNFGVRIRDPFWKSAVVEFAWEFCVL